MPRLFHDPRPRFPSPDRSLSGLPALILVLLVTSAPAAGVSGYVNPEEPPYDPAKAMAALADTGYRRRTTPV